MSAAPLRCIYCDRGSDEVPILSLEYLGRALAICTQHLPVLIHDPARLAGKLKGAEQLERAEESD